MNEGAFWGLIARLDWKQTGNDDHVVEPVVKALSAMPETEIAAFHKLLTRKLHALDGRAWARESGSHVWWGEPDKLSVDGFLYARCVVVANGREFFETVRRDPKQMPKDMEFEALISIAPKAYERKTGREGAGELDTEMSFETFSNRAGWWADGS